ncbi:MAG: SUMF1/EgtB/PvdO family nonheme iron enzyme [Thermoanaerobaculia bacterium]
MNAGTHSSPEKAARLLLAACFAMTVDAAAQPVMVSLPGGTFQMGDHAGFVDPSHPSDEVPIHEVQVSAFQIGKTDVTVQQYRDFLAAAYAQGTIRVSAGTVTLAGGTDVLFLTRAADPYSRIGWDGSVFTVLDGRGDHPVTSVLWFGAVAYCNWLSLREGRTPCYDTTTWTCDFTKDGYRLPTEAEWEYAGRGGRTSPYTVYPWGDTPDRTKANWPSSGDPYEVGALPWTTPVGFYDGTLKRKADYGWPGSAETYQTSDGANGFGLYDMAGNVWQWCHDWYGKDYYASSPSVDPSGPATGTPMPDGKPYRVLRGGNWYNGDNVGGVDDGHSRVSNRDPSYYRGPQDPNHPWYHVGFRPARRASSTTGVTRFLPIVLDVTGRARYVSELTLANRGSSSASVTLLYTAASAFGGQGSGSVSLSLAAGRQLVLDDAIGSLRSSGLSIPSGNQGGSLRVTFANVSSADAAYAGVRITAPSENGRAGVAYVGPLLEALPSSTSWLYGLRSSSEDRTNVAFANASTSSSVTLRLTLVNGNGSSEKHVFDDVTLGPGQWAQLDDVFVGTGFSQGYASVSVVSGSGPYFAYAVFNDNGTNDGSFAPFESEPAPSEARLVPVVVETGTYSSELVLANTSSTARTVELSYVESLSPSQGAGGTTTESLAAGEQKILPSILDLLRTKVGSIGPSGGSYAGSLSARFLSGGNLVAGYAGARTGSPARSGTGRYGLFYAGVGTSSRASSAAWVYGLRQDSLVRTNVAVAASPENSSSITVHAEVWNGSTGSLAGTTDSVTLSPGGWKQWANLLPTYGVAQGYVRVVSDSSSGSFTAYAVVNDGPAPGSANGTDDGSFVPAVNVAASAGSASLTLESPAFATGGALPVEYTCDGAGASPPLAWSGVPAGTAELALMMTTLAKDGEKWNWVLYGIPATVTALARNSTGVGTAGLTSDGPLLAYSPPCSQGPGAKTYTFSLYALSSAPTLPSSASPVTGPVLTAAIEDLTLATSRLDVTYAR